jgi:hypothetical protein
MRSAASRNSVARAGAAQHRIIGDISVIFFTARHSAVALRIRSA